MMSVWFKELDLGPKNRNIWNIWHLEHMCLNWKTLVKLCSILFIHFGRTKLNLPKIHCWLWGPMLPQPGLYTPRIAHFGVHGREFLASWGRYLKSGTCWSWHNHL
jgi:hypothetical protein